MAIDHEIQTGEQPVISPEESAAEQLALFPSAETQFDYTLLKEHYRTDGSRITTEQLHSEYVELTDELIRQMTEGLEVRTPATGEREIRTPDVVVWLDKSARPVSWLTKELWGTLAPEPESDEVPPMPAFRFVNIDREQWVNTVDPYGTGYLDIDRVDPSIVRSLRSIFVPPYKKKEGITPDIDDQTAELDGKTVLIVDEVRATGRTLEIARRFFEKAFPTAMIATTHWMKGTVQLGDRKSGDAQGNADLPVWYKEAHSTGRGVGNRNEVVSSRSPSSTQRLGAWFLSTRLSDAPDPESAQLRSELHQLAEDVRDKRILVMPSIERDDYIERATSLNGISFEDFKEEKNQLAAN